jgi:hypothetical protein
VRPHRKGIVYRNGEEWEVDGHDGGCVFEVAELRGVIVGFEGVFFVVDAMF